MQESITQLKQIKFRANTEIEDLKDEVREVNKRLYPIGTYVDIRRGKGVWREVEVLGFNSRKDPEALRGKTASGKIHWFNTADIID